MFQNEIFQNNNESQQENMPKNKETLQLPMQKAKNYNCNYRECFNDVFVLITKKGNQISSYDRYWVSRWEISEFLNLSPKCAQMRK